MTLPSFSFGLDLGELAIALGDRGLIGEIFAASALTDPLTGLVRLPGWMRIKCDTVGRTAQQSASTVMSGYDAHSARAFSQDGTTYGLLVEPPTTNLVDAQPTEAGWVYSATTNSATGPDGSTGGYEVEDVSGATVQAGAHSLTPGVIVLPHTLSSWHQLLSPTPTTAGIIHYEDGDQDPTITLTVVEPEWTLSEVTVTSIDDGTLRIRPRETTVADLGALRVYQLQLEAGVYATSYHASSRLADQLEAVTSAIVPDGYLRFDMSYRPHYADTEATVDHNLWRIDDANRVYFRESDSNIVFVSQGDELASGALTFSAHQTLTLFWENSPTRRRLIVSGATTGDGTTDGTIQAALDPNTTATFTTILGGAAGAEEAADLILLDPNVRTFPELADSRALVQMDDTVGNRDFRDLLRVFAEQPGRFFDVCTGLKAALELETACGAQLDLIGAATGLAREGATDERYRTFLGIQVELLLAQRRGDAEWTGTAPNILRIAREFIGPAGTLTYIGIPPYAFKLDTDVTLPLAEIKLLARFLTTAVYAAVLGFLEFPLTTDVWGSDGVVVADVGTWGSASVVVAGASSWDIVITTV